MYNETKGNFAKLAGPLPRRPVCVRADEISTGTAMSPSVIRRSTLTDRDWRLS